MPGEHGAVAATLDQSVEIVHRQCLGCDAVSRAQLELQAFERTRVVVEDLFAADRLLAALDHVEVALGRAHVPEASSVLVGVRAAAEAAVVALAPVQEVVATLVPGLRPVADLVADEA